MTKKQVDPEKLNELVKGLLNSRVAEYKIPEPPAKEDIIRKQVLRIGKDCKVKVIRI